MSHTIRASFDAATPSNGPRWRMHVVVSPDGLSAGRVIDLIDGESVVGRSAGTGPNALTIDDQRLSRRHATLTVDFQTDELHVEDLKSSNGTWIRGKRVTRQQLKHGAVLRIGNTVAVLERDNGTCADFGGSIAGIPGFSEYARGLRERVTGVARGFVPVLIIGPPGSGKGKLAREIHRQSGRTGNKVAVRMEQLATDEAFDILFGGGRHQEGLLKQAAGGTLILERADQMAENLQIALRRLLTDASRLADYDARIVALSTASLLDLAEKEKFDPRLAELLMDHAIEVPPLAARKTDLVAIADALAPLTDSRYASTWSTALDADAAEMLLHHRWPDNLRELKKVLRPLVHTIGADGCGVEDLPVEIIRAVKDGLHGPQRSPQSVVTASRPRYTSVQLCHLLAVHGGVREMASALGCSPDALLHLFRSAK